VGADGVAISRQSVALISYSVKLLYSTYNEQVARLFERARKGKKTKG
jgi:hypothetical protein